MFSFEDSSRPFFNRTKLTPQQNFMLTQAYFDDGIYCRAKALNSPENDLDIHFIGSFIRYTNPSEKERMRICSHNYGAVVMSCYCCDNQRYHSIFAFPISQLVNHLLGKCNIVYIVCAFRFTAK